MDQQTEQLLLGYIEGELDEEQRWQAEALLTQRPELAKWVRAMRDDRETIRTLPQAEVPEAVTDAIESLREREALLGPSQGTRRSGRIDRGQPKRGPEPAVAGRITPTDAEAGDRSLSTRRWGVRLAVAAAVLLCAGVMLEAIVGTNLLIPAGQDAEVVDALAMEVRSGRAAAEAPEPETVPASQPIDRSQAAVEPAAALAPTPPEAEATELEDTRTDEAVSIDEVLAAVTRPVDDETSARDPGTLGLVARRAPLGDVAATADAESAAGRTPDATVDDGSDPTTVAVEIAEAIAEPTEPQIRLEVDANDQALAFGAVREWAISNSFAVVSGDESATDRRFRMSRAAVGPSGAAAREESILSGITGSRFAAVRSREVERRAMDAEDFGVQVVQLAVPEAEVGALVAYLEGQGGNAVRLLGADGPAAAGQPMALDQHPQVQWVPPAPDAEASAIKLDDASELRQQDIAASVDAEEADSFYAEEPLPLTESTVASPEASPAQETELGRLAGVDLFALMRSRAPRTPTQPLSEVMPQRPVLVELLIRQNAEPLPTAPAEPIESQEPASAE
ncbi:MAG: hypothetical protein AAF078_03865 [Planctomycetota bacterium]